MSQVYDDQAVEVLVSQLAQVRYLNEGLQAEVEKWKARCEQAAELLRPYEWRKDMGSWERKRDQWFDDAGIGK